MKALVVLQPYAELTVAGIKTIEVRSWPIKYRGPLVIVAGKRLHPQPPAVLKDYAHLPRGRAVGIVELVGCVPFERHHAPRACVPWAPGLFAWKYHGRVRLPEIPVKGRLGLFEVKL